MTLAKRTEHAEAVAFMRVVKLHENREPRLRMLLAVPNGGDRHKIVAAKMKAEGVKPGVPDYLLPVTTTGYSGLAIELKSMTGYASKEQKQWIADLREQGWRAEVCRGWEQAWGVVRDYLSIGGTSDVRKVT